MFSIVQFWEPPPISGPERGRLFEQILYDYCDYRHLDLVERAGSRTLRGERAASGFMHESDAVIATPELTVHLELKHLTSELGKNELLVFNQKGIDFLMTDNAHVRSKSLYRIVLSGNLLAQAARRFAIQWGILAIEPDRLPLLILYQFANLYVDGLRGVDEKAQKVIKSAVPHSIVPLQNKIRQLADALSGNKLLMESQFIDELINVFQREYGDEYWISLDAMNEENWLEKRFDKLSWILGLDDICYPGQ